MQLMIRQTISFALGKNMMFNMHNQNVVTSFMDLVVMVDRGQLFNYNRKYFKSS